MTPHLTENQLADLLLTHDEPEANLPADEEQERIAAHLAHCSTCLKEFELFRSTMASFNAVTLAWSEQRSITRPSAPDRKGKTGWAGKLGWVWSVALMGVLSVGFAAHRSWHPATSGVSSEPAHMVDQNSEAEILRDNELMVAVNQELARTEPFPLTADDLFTPEPGRAGRSRAEASVE